jgi:hypothetical protein
MADKKPKSKEKSKSKDVSLDVLDLKIAMGTMSDNVSNAFQDVYDKLSELNSKINKVSDRLGL